MSLYWVSLETPHDFVYLLHKYNVHLFFGSRIPNSAIDNKNMDELYKSHKTC